MSDGKRPRRVAEEIRKHIAEAFGRELFDPRLIGLMVTRVEVGADLSSFLFLGTPFPPETELVDTDDAYLVSVITIEADTGRVFTSATATKVFGASDPYGPAPAMRPADFIHGTDGLGETFRDAPRHRPVA